jgi:TATA-box binding protein (TBP) (component of TFIID and TFIIIB)
MDTVAYAKEYLDLMKVVHGNGNVLNVSTITLICNLNVERICMQTFCERFDEKGIEMKRYKRNKDFEITKRGKIKKSFFNQVTLNYSDISKKSIKVFSNGKLQITGLTSCLECNKVSDMVNGWLKKYLQEDICITKMYIGMINSNFSIMTNLDLVKLNGLLNLVPNVISIYNPESYPAINMKYIAPEISVSVFIFATGNIVITGGKKLWDMRVAYEFIHDIVTKHMNIVGKKSEQPSKTVRAEPYVCGYPIRQCMSCTV